MTVWWKWVVLEMGVVSSAANVGFIEPGSRWAAVERHKAGPGSDSSGKAVGTLRHN
jgi:hypothetical protein